MNGSPMTANGTSRQFDAVHHTASVGGSDRAFAFEYPGDRARLPG